MENTSGQGKGTAIPPEINKWNWGAFFLNWIWGLCNNVYIALLCLIPFINIIMIFVLGARGNEWAWQNKRWNSLEDFLRIQKRWAWCGFGIFLIVLLLSLAIALATPASESPQIKTIF